LADEARCDEALALLIPQLSAAAAPVRVHVLAEMTEPDAASALVNCLTVTVARCGTEYTAVYEQRLLRIMELVVQFLQCDGHAEEDPPSTKVRMSSLKDRQLALVKAGCSEVLFTLLGLGPAASDQVFATTARVIGLTCCATDLREAPSPTKSKKAGKKPKTQVNPLCQEGFAPFSKNLLAQLKVHGDRRDSAALASLCEVILHIGRENPATQRRLLDVQAVGLLLEQLKALPSSYADLSDDSPAPGCPSPRQIVLSQKSHVIQAIKLVVDPSHRRSKAVNGKVQKAAESIRDNADEDADVKQCADDILAKFAAAALESPRESDIDSPRDSPREGDPDSPRLERKESKKEKRARLKEEAAAAAVAVETIAEEATAVKVDTVNEVEAGADAG